MLLENNPYQEYACAMRTIAATVADISIVQVRKMAKSDSEDFTIFSNRTDRFIGTFWLDLYFLLYDMC